MPHAKERKAETWVETDITTNVSSQVTVDFLELPKRSINWMCTLVPAPVTTFEEVMLTARWKSCSFSTLNREDGIHEC